MRARRSRRSRHVSAASCGQRDGGLRSRRKASVWTSATPGWSATNGAKPSSTSQSTSMSGRARLEVGDRREGVDDVAEGRELDDEQPHGASPERSSMKSRSRGKRARDDLPALRPPLPGRDMGGARQAGGDRSLDVEPLVAGEERAAEVEVEALRRGEDHPRRRLPPAACRRLRRMAAGIFGVEDDALGRQQIAEARGDRLVVVPAVEAAADAGLVGDDHQRIAGIAKPAERLRHAGQNAARRPGRRCSRGLRSACRRGRGRAPGNCDAAIRRARKRWKPSSTRRLMPCP